jgi:L-lactate utilization protein LutB
MMAQGRACACQWIRRKSMDKPIENYWRIRLENLKSALEANNFDVYIAETKEDAKKIFLDEILPKTDAKSVSWGGSMTLVGTGLYHELKDRSDLSVLDTFDRNISPEESTERRRRALTVDLFITGTNAVTESGQLVNLDMIGNRVAALVFGPKQVVVFVGRNKLVADLEEAMLRVKNYVAPVNAMRLDKKTPCVKTSYCEECKSPDRICNAWTISEKSFPKGRVKIVLINEDIGF